MDDGEGKLRRSLVSCLAYALRLSSKLGCASATPKLNQVLRELVEDSTGKPKRKISLFEGLNLQESDEAVRSSQTCSRESHQSVKACHVSTQTYEEPISERQCKALVQRYEEALQTVIREVTDFDRRLLVQERAAPSEVTSRTSGSDQSMIPPRAGQPTVRHGSFNYLRESEPAFQPESIQILRNQHRAQRLALKEERRRIRAGLSVA